MKEPKRPSATITATPPASVTARSSVAMPATSTQSPATSTASSTGSVRGGAVGACASMGARFRPTVTTSSAIHPRSATCRWISSQRS